jgi:hypothetical protein
MQGSDQLKPFLSVGIPVARKPFTRAAGWHGISASRHRLDAATIAAATLSMQSSKSVTEKTEPDSVPRNGKKTSARQSRVLLEGLV